MARLLAGDRWDLVFNIAEGVRGFAREAQVPCLLDLYGIPYTFSDAVVLALTLHKGLTNRVVRDAGVPTAPFAVVAGPDDLGAVDFPGPWFVKPVAEGTGKGVDAKSVVRRRADLARRCRELTERFRQPALVEGFLPGREFTTGISGSGQAARVIGTMEVILKEHAEAEVYSYVNKERCEELVEYRLVRPADDPLVAEAEGVALAAWRVLYCRDAGRVDLRCDADGRVCFIEVNPLAGLHPEHSDLPILSTKAGLSYDELIRRIVDSACLRLDSADRDRA
jgi:D-alanine-D-alanine ligase